MTEPRKQGWKASLTLEDAYQKVSLVKCVLLRLTSLFFIRYQILNWRNLGIPAILIQILTWKNLVISALAYKIPPGNWEKLPYLGSPALLWVWLHSMGMADCLTWGISRAGVLPRALCGLWSLASQVWCLEERAGEKNAVLPVTCCHMTRGRVEGLSLPHKTWCSVECFGLRRDLCCCLFFFFFFSCRKFTQDLL